MRTEQQAEVPQIHQLNLGQAQTNNDFEQQVLFSPSTQGSRYMKLSLMYGQPGAIHRQAALPGDQMTLTLQGEATVTAGDQPYRLPVDSALLVPAGAAQTVEVSGDGQWMAISASCDECPLMREHASSGAGKTTASELALRQTNEVAPERLYGFERRVFFSPSTTASRYMKFAIVHGIQGAKSVAHTHPGGELALTLGGNAHLTVHGERYDLSAGTALAVPADVQHPAESDGPDDWVVVTSYCDECPLMRQQRLNRRSTE